MSETPFTLPAVQPLLPRRARGDRPLLVIMAVMAFLAGLALLIAIWGTRAGQIWTSDLDGKMTVQVLDASQAPLALETLSGFAGLTATQLSEAEVDALLAPWLGNAELPDDIPVPALISVQGNPAPAEIADALTSAGIEAEVDDHQRWANRIRRIAFWVQFGALAVLSIILAAGAATSSFATEAALRAEETVIRVLGQVGAQDRFVARLFVSRFFFAGLKAGIAGALGAMGFGLLLGMVFGAPFGLSGMTIICLALLPILFGLISAISAGWMALSLLKSERAAK